MGNLHTGMLLQSSSLHSIESPGPILELFRIGSPGVSRVLFSLGQDRNAKAPITKYGRYRTYGQVSEIYTSRAPWRCGGHGWRSG